MARQIGYGALTVTDVTDGINNATIYLYHRYPDASDNDITQGTTGHELPLNNALEYNFTTGRLSSIHGDNDDFRGWTQTIPSGTDAIYVTTAVATSVENTYIVPSWSTAVKLATNGANGVDGADGLSVKVVRELYYFKRTTDSNPQDLSQITPTPTIYTDTEPGHWTSKTPSYLAGGTYYTCIETTLSNNTKTYSSPAVNEALTDANNNAAIAKSIAQANEENAQGALAISQGLESRLRYIWVNLNEPSLPSDDTNTNVYLGGTYAASGIDGTTFVSSNPSTYGFNSLLRHTKLMFRYNGIALTTIGLDGLKLFAPLITNNVITGHQLSIELTGGNTGALNFYNPKTGKVGLSLNKDNITFYKHDSTTAAATLNGTGLNIAAGSIKLGDNFEATSDGTITAKKGTIGGWSIGSNDLYTGTWGTNGSAMLCTGTSGSKSIGGSASINNWVFTAGANFGVTKSGVLYATSAKIDGDITARSLKIGNDSTSVTTNAILNTNVRSQNFSEGTMLFKDPTFASGVNGTNLYDNNHSGKTTWTRAAKSSDNPISSTSYEMVCKNTATGPSPGLGGFYWSHASRANGIFLYRIIAKIPTGHNLQFASNATGNDTNREWLTPNAGTGKFTEYIFKLICGSSGTFSTTGFFYIDGAASVTWYVAYATAYDMTAIAEVKNYITEVNSSGITIHPSGGTTNRIELDGSGMRVYKGGSLRATYADSVTLQSSNGTYPKMTVSTTEAYFQQSSNSWATMNSNGFVIRKDGVDVASFGTTLRVGQSGKQRIEVTSNGIAGYTSDNKGMLQLSPTWHCFGDPGSTRITMGLSGDPYVYMNAGGKTAFNVSAKADGSNTILDLYGNNAVRVRVDKNGMTLYNGGGTADTNRLAVYSGGVYLYKPGTTTALVSITTSGASFNGTITTSNIVATGGQIGRYSITSTYLMAGSGSTATGIGGDQAFFAGNSTSNSAPFRVSYSGDLVATKANISGTITTSNITATGGKIAQYTIVDRRIESTGGGYRAGMQSFSSSATAAAFYAGCNTAAGGAIAGSAYSRFYVTHGGTLYTQDIQIGNSTYGIINYNTFVSTSNVNKSSFTPASSGKSNLGSESNRWDYIYTSHNVNTSDRKEKDNIIPITKAKEFILSLEPVNYYFKDGNHLRKHMGFIAQDVAEVCKKLQLDLSVVSAGYKDIEGKGYYGEKVNDELLSWGLEYKEFIAPMVAVIQEQHKEIEQLKKEVTELKNK